MQIHELDCVRITCDFTGEQLFSPGTATVREGAEGCAVSAYSDACHVEFDNNVVLTVPNDLLEKYWDAATGRRVA